MPGHAGNCIDKLLSVSGRLLLFAPHPDDETLAAGGLIQRALAAGVAVTVVFATDGDNAPWTQRLVEGRWRIGTRDRQRFGRRRRAEARRALHALGVPPDRQHFLGFPDQGLTAALLAGDGALPCALVGLLRLEQPDLVVAPSLDDTHPDHGALAVLVRMALDRARLQRSPRLLGYRVHGDGGTLPPRDMQLLGLDAEEQALKRHALLAHATQLAAHPRSLLAFQADAERFELDGSRATAGAPAPTSPAPAAAAFAGDACGPPPSRHPLRVAAGREGAWRVVMKSRMWRRGASRSRLLLVAPRAGGGVQTASIVLHPEGSASILEPRTGRRLAFTTWTRRGGACEIDIPNAFGAAGSDVFLKLERGRGFFDEAGWLQARRPSPMPRAAHGMPPVVCAVIPCFNVAAFCAPVVLQALSHADQVLAVDDGSTDGTSETLRLLASRSGGRLRVLSFATNRGKGTALLQAFGCALSEFSFDVLVTLDGDGQHRVSDLPRLARAIADGAEFAIGTRMDFQAMPFRSRLGNTLTCWLMRLAAKDCPRDTQSGFRAFSRGFLEEVVARIPGRRYETELRILALALSQRRRCASVPIPTIYRAGNASSHFRPLVDSARIYGALVWNALPSLIALHVRGRRP